MSENVIWWEFKSLKNKSVKYEKQVKARDIIRVVTELSRAAQKLGIEKSLIINCRGKKNDE